MENDQFNQFQLANAGNEQSALASTINLAKRVLIFVIFVYQRWASHDEQLKTKKIEKNENNIVGHFMMETSCW